MPEEALHKPGAPLRMSARAKADGKYTVRKPTARAKAADAHKLHREGRAPTEIAKALGVENSF